MSFILWPNGRNAAKLWHGVNVPYAGPQCGQRSPDGRLVCQRHLGHAQDQACKRPELHLAFAPMGGSMENIAEWLEGDLNCPLYADRNDQPIINPPPTMPAQPSLPSTPCPPLISPPDPPALISRDRQTAVFYGEVYELDLIPDATDEDYRNLPTLEQLNKMRRG